MSLGLLLAACTQNPVPEIAELDPGAPALPVVTAAGRAAEVWQQLQIDLNGDDLVGKDGALAHIGADLALLYRRHQAFVRQGSVGTFLPTRTYIRLSADRVVIDAVAVDDAAALLADLEALGLDHGATFGRYVSGRLPIAAIADAAALASLKFARPAAAMTWVGLTDSQGDASMRSDEARTLFAVDGSGVTIGTLSDSFDCFGDAATDVASGDLPAGIVVLDDLTGPDCIGAIDEGRAMMQLITDVAPGASQSFHTAFQGQADFASGIVELQAAGADVINDDVFYFAEPFFQDGIIAQAVDTVFAAGAAYFSSAGNANRSAYQSPFDPSGLACPAVLGPGFAPCEPHDFDPGAGVDIFQNVTIPEGTSFTQSFQWDEPFFSVSGAPGSANDYDIFLLNGAADTLLDFGAAINFGDDPVEIIQYTNPIGSGETSFNFLITKFDPLNTTDAGLMHFNLYGGNSIVFNEFGTNSPTSSGHSIAAGGQGVGAAFYQETPEFGVDPALPETFSSAGVLPILFDTSGNRLGTTGTDGTQLNIAEIRNKPDIVAPDGTNTTFFGSSDPKLDGFPNFFGTSAPAPHAAAVAGLMKEFKPTLMPDQIYSALEDTALDMSALPIMQTAAFDFDTGFGLIQADAALASIDTPSIAFAQTAVSVDEGAGTATITITVQRLGSSIGAVGVDIATSDDTATAGSDYTGIAETLSWADGDSSDKTATVPITDDPDDEPSETVNLALSNPTGGAVVSTPSATLTITDNDNSTLTLATGPTPPAADVSGDPGDEVAVLQATVALSAGAEDLDVTLLEVSSTAAGIDASTNDITARVYSDDNANGQVDAGEAELAQAAFGGATIATLDLDGAGNAITLSAGDSATLLVTFEVASPLPSAVLGLLLAPLALWVLRHRRRLATWLVLALLVVALAGCPGVTVDTTRTYTSSVTDITVLSPVPDPDVVGLPVGGSTLSVVP